MSTENTENTGASHNDYGDSAAAFRRERAFDLAYGKRHEADGILEKVLREANMIDRYLAVGYDGVVVAKQLERIATNGNGHDDVAVSGTVTASLADDDVDLDDDEDEPDLPAPTKAKRRGGRPKGSRNAPKVAKATRGKRKEREPGDPVVEVHGEDRPQPKLVEPGPESAPIHAMPNGGGDDAPHFADAA